MDDISRIAGSVVGPLYLAIFMTAVALARVMPSIMDRLNERRRDGATILGGQLERMDARLQRLEASEERCRRELADAQGRLATVEGYMHGRGKADAEAQAIVSIERLKRDKSGETK